MLVVFKGVIVKRGEIEIPTLDCSLATFSQEKVALSSRPQAKVGLRAKVKKKCRPIRDGTFHFSS